MTLPLKFLNLFSTTSTDKKFENNSNFGVKKRTTGKVQFLFSRSLLLVLTKLSFLGEDWALGYNSMKFGHYFQLSYFPKILNLKSFGNS